MALFSHTVARSANAPRRDAQPSTALPPPAREDPSLCKAPRLRPIPLPPLSPRDAYTYFPTASVRTHHVKDWQGQAADGGALHFYPGVQAAAVPRATPSSPPARAFPLSYGGPTTPPTMAAAAYYKGQVATQAGMNAAPQAHAVPVPKRRVPSSLPLTPTSSPPGRAAAPVQSRRRRTSAVGAQHGTFPTT